ncbi:hypothetical protein JTB14_004262 [Gonioctena quinquepunctata]|nr:hypothetical protein JTB14_004262 [Gonioctena quinquepunctata]
MLLDKIIDFQNIIEESAHKIKLHDVSNECFEAIKNIGYDKSSWDPIIGRIIARKWDTETNRLYEEHLKDLRKVSSFQEIFDFMKRRFQSLETVSDLGATSGDSQQTYQRHNCPMCEVHHPAWRCAKFRRLFPQERITTIKKNLYAKAA